MICKKPNCDCIDAEIKKQETEFIKSYPCLGACCAPETDMELSKSFNGTAKDFISKIAGFANNN